MRRRLAASLATEVVGYARLMVADESDTLRRLIHSVVPAVALLGLRCGVMWDAPKGHGKESDHG